MYNFAFIKKREYTFIKQARLFSIIWSCFEQFSPKALARKEAVVEVELGSCAPAAAALVERRSDAGSMNTSDEPPVSRTPPVPLLVPRAVSRDLRRIHQRE